MSLQCLVFVRKFDKNAENIFGKVRDGKTGDSVFGQRRISPSTLAAMGLGGTALATNAGLGLNLPGEFGIGEETGIPGVGRREGYAAASPDELDPRKSTILDLKLLRGICFPEMEDCLT